MNRDLPPTIVTGGPPNVSTPWLIRALRGATAGLLALTLAFTAASARAEDLDEEKKKLDAEIAQSKEDLHDYNRAAAKAAADLRASQNKLSEAEQALVSAQSAELDAKSRDARAAAELKSAEEALTVAKKEAVSAAAAVEAWMKTVGRVVIQTQQQRTDLLALTVITTNSKMASMNQRVQWSRSMMDSTQAKLDRLQSLQLAKEGAEQKAAKVEAEVSAKREAAAKAYTAAQSATTATEQARDARASALTANAEAKKAADGQVKAEQSRQSELESESNAVARRIAERIAAEKEAAARAKAKAAAQAEARAKAQVEARAKAQAEERAKAQAEARARAEAEAAERRAAAARAEARRIASQRASAQRQAVARAAAKKAEQEAAEKRAAAQRAASQRAADKKANEEAANEEAANEEAANEEAANKETANEQPSSESASFIYPSSGAITSPFGQRFHPILRYWKLHDGTDFGAGCGTPIRSAAAGVVQERYFNAGYGNRLIVDHGKVEGRYVTTAYNHATHYVVGVGQRVAQGEILGYVGSTGYSTGCHLHYMTYVNGDLANPMSLY